MQDFNFSKIAFGYLQNQFFLVHVLEDVEAYD